ncbi:hypothetical protein KPL47_16220 [Clostridium estertheticum]|uniref:hypothetical protein n=1 Tax=Clostridium estertheticum TaxID=238834 RepID=UPI001C0AF817|nr:hypothetical protein [Clostridium estertheticum]MBU3177876.1 hypothetical protein [Clostridium estertheticum]
MDILLNFIEGGKLVEIISVQGCDSMCKKIMVMCMTEGSIIKFNSQVLRAANHKDNLQ